MGKIFSSGVVSKISESFIRLRPDDEVSIHEYLVAEAESKINSNWKVGASFIGAFDETDGFGDIWVIPNEARDAWLNNTWQEYLNNNPEIRKYLDNVHDENSMRLTIIFG